MCFRRDSGLGHGRTVSVSMDLCLVIGLLGAYLFELFLVSLVNSAENC